MKKLQIILSAAISVAALSANAQLLSAKLPATEAKADIAIPTAETGTANSAAIKFSKSGIKAASNFKKNFLDGSDVKWCVEEKVITASFNRDQVRTTVVYDKHGHWLRNMRIYNEAQMSPGLKATIMRSRFRKYNITQVQEFLEDDLFFYVVHLENDRSYKQLTVYNGEINVLSQYDK